MRRNERRLLGLFLGTYLISTFVMVSVIMWLLYSGELQSLKEKERLGMQEFTARIASELIDAQMMGRRPDLSAFNTYHYTLYDKNKKPVMGRNNKMIQWQQTYYMSGASSIYVSRAAKGHHGVEYIVVEDFTFEQDKKAARYRLILIYIAALAGILVIAWILSRIFLQPIRQKVEALDRFVKDSTHELNTPITAMMLSLNSLEKEPSDHKALQRIKLSAKKLSHLYADLTFSQFASTEKPDCEAIDIKKVVDEVLLFHEPFAQQKKIVLHRSLETLFFAIEKEAAFRLISNLVANAVKYTPKGGEVMISLDRGELKVCDTGQGMSAKQIKVIFERYQRCDEVGGGFGIGLDLVSRIAAIYGITIDVDSEPLKGSCFRLGF